MSDYYYRDSQESIAVHRAGPASGSTVYDHMGYSPSQDYSPSLHSSLSQGYHGGRGNGERTAQMLRGAQNTYGNRAVQRSLTRAGSQGNLAVQRGWWQDYINKMGGKELANTGEKPRDPVYRRENEAGGYEAGFEGLVGSGSILGMPFSTIFAQTEVQAGKWGGKGIKAQRLQSR